MESGFIPSNDSFGKNSQKFELKSFVSDQDYENVFNDILLNGPAKDGWSQFTTKFAMGFFLWAVFYIFLIYIISFFLMRNFFNSGDFIELIKIWSILGFFVLISVVSYSHFRNEKFKKSVKKYLDSKIFNFEDHVRNYRLLTTHLGYELEIYGERFAFINGHCLGYCHKEDYVMIFFRSDFALPVFRERLGDEQFEFLLLHLKRNMMTPPRL